MERVAAFTQIKQLLASDCVLASPDPNEPFLLQTDTSGVGIIAILSQIQENGEEKPVGYYFRQMLPRERRYTVSEQECLGVVEGIQHFKIYLSSGQFTVVTHHRCLTYLHKFKDENG